MLDRTSDLERTELSGSGQAPTTGAAHRKVWRYAAYAVALVLGLGVAYCLIRKPLSVSDCLNSILAAQYRSSRSMSLWDAFINTLSTRAYFRPLFTVQVDLLFDLAGGRYYLAYTGFHIAQTLALVLLFVRVLDVRSRFDLAAAILAVTVLLGIHTSLLLFLETFVINTFLEITVLCLVVIVCAQATPRLLNDLVALSALAIASWTLESGVLLWVCMVMAYLTGMRGVSFKGVMAGTIFMASYFVLRFAVYDVGMPGLDERESGFGFERLDPSELIERFGSNPLPFYAYNIVSSVLSVLFAEPRAGVWGFVRAWQAGRVPIWMSINVFTSVSASLLIALFCLRRWRSWTARRFEKDDQLMLIFIATLGANAVLSYAYAKDVIMSPAGTLYAVAVFIATRDVLRRLADFRPPLELALPILLALLLVSAGWSARTLGLYYNLRLQAFRHSNDWALVHRFVRQEELRNDPGIQALVKRLRAEAVEMPVPNPHLARLREGTSEEYFDQGY